MNLNILPEWLGTAIIAAIFTTLGFLGRNIFSSIEKRRSRKADNIRQLEKFRNLVKESRSVFFNQNYLARR